ncbi:hypothetical protein B0H13DRAFT_2026848 [Mycena leptocephala]|nr:hypothetical protein B0H13DRAFT_2026848 [Mycena leptocephala]
MAERPYDKSDFVGLKRRKPYIVMIERQLEKFPKGLNLSKINIPDTQKLLLDPEIGFTTNLPGEHTPGILQIPRPHLSEPPNPKYAGVQQTSPTPESHNKSPTGNASFPKGLEDTMSKIQPDVRNVQLRIRDRRSGTSEFNIIQRVNINVVDNVDCGDNECLTVQGELGFPIPRNENTPNTS